MKSAPPRCCFRVFRPLWPGEPAALPVPDLAERQVDLVVDRDHARSSGTPYWPRAGPTRAAGLVHVGLRQQHRDPRAARSGAPLGDQPAEALRGLRQLPARGEHVRDLEADVVPRARVLRPGIPEPDDQKVDGAAGRARPRNRRTEGLAILFAAAARPRRRPRRRLRPRPAPPRPRRASPSSPTSSASSSISSSSSTSDGAVIVATTISSRSPRISTPAGALTLASVIVSAMPMPGDVGDDPVGDVGRQRLDRDLARDVLEHAALAHARRVLDALELERDGRLDLLVEADLQQVEVLHVRPRTGSRCWSLTITGWRPPPSTSTSKSAWPSASTARSRRRVDLERDGVAVDAVDDAGHEAVRRSRRLAREPVVARRAQMSRPCATTGF